MEMEKCIWTGTSNGGVYLDWDGTSYGGVTWAQLCLCDIYINRDTYLYIKYLRKYLS